MTKIKNECQEITSVGNGGKKNSIYIYIFFFFFHEETGILTGKVTRPKWLLELKFEITFTYLYITMVWLWKLDFIFQRLITTIIINVYLSLYIFTDYQWMQLFYLQNPSNPHSNYTNCKVSFSLFCKWEYWVFAQDHISTE